MKVATYNVRVDTDYDKNWQWHNRKEAICRLIAYHDWTLCGIQEVRPNQVRDLEQLEEYTCLSAERDGDGQGEGLAILYKEQQLERITSGSFWLSQTPDRPSIHPEAGYPRIALWALFCEKGQAQPFLVINVHLDHVSEAARFSGMEVVLACLQEKIKQYPTILMGDFNAENGEAVHRIIEKMFKPAKKPMLHYGPIGTFQNFDYNRPWAQLEEIDYIYTKGWFVQQTASLTDSLDGRYPSDHFPLEAELFIEER